MHRAKNLLIEADGDAEKLLGIVRMAIAAVLAFVLTAAVNAPNRQQSAIFDTQIVVATIVIASYFAIGLAAYVIVRAGHYRMWMAWVTAILDVTLITANLWLSVGNAGIGSLYALSFPAALMIPLVLTFGALRFRPSIQIVATLLMGAAILSILFSTPDPPLGGQHLLRHLHDAFGVTPNLIRTVMIMSTGAVIALAAWRAGRLLRRIAAEIEQRANLTRFLPRGVAEDMSNDALQKLRAGRNLELAIMFVDIRGFTGMAEQMSPDTASRLLGDYRSNILDIIEARGGIVDKFIGDGALVLFGLTTPPQQAAVQALLASTELLHRMQNWNARRLARQKPEIRVGIGLHLGDVIVGAIGDERRLEFTVIGDEVNVAARVEQATKSVGFSLLATDTLIQAARAADDDEWQSLGPRELRGRGNAVRLWAYRQSSG